MSRRADGTDDLIEWLGYLKDIGVRDLRAGAPPDRRPQPPGGTARPPGGQVPRARPGADHATGGGESAGRPQRGAADPMLAGLAWGAAGSEGGEDPAGRLATVREELGDCTRCRLHEGRTHIVFGVGNPRAGMMFIGEGPGVDEDAQGEPFVGRAGRKLNEMIRAIGLEREEVYIANVVKCRPPDNRDPKPDEVATCSPFLFRQIEAIRPKVIVTLGSPATKLLLNTSAGITRLRGTWQEFRGIPVMPTFHPAYLLRAYTRDNRQKVWEDLKAARARMDEPS